MVGCFRLALCSSCASGAKITSGTAGDTESMYTNELVHSASGNQGTAGAMIINALVPMALQYIAVLVGQRACMHLTFEGIFGSHADSFWHGKGRDTLNIQTSCVSMVP